MTLLNVCTTEDAQISWGERADSALYHVTCTVSQLGVSPDGIFWFIFTSAEPQGKGLASAPDPRQTLSLTPRRTAAPGSPLWSQLPLCPGI